MPIHTFYTVKDGKGDSSTVTIDIPDGTSELNAVLFAGLMAGLLDDLIHGGITEVGIAIPITWAPQVPDVASDLQEGARFFFRCVNNFSKKLRIPAFWESKFNAGTRLVNQADVDVAAFVTAMEDGIEVVPGTTITPVNSHGEDIVALEAAVESWGRDRG